MSPASSGRAQPAGISRQPGAPAVVLALLCALYLILFVNRVNLSTAAPLVKAELGLSNTQLGLVFSAFAIPYAVLQLAGGWIGDTFGPRLVLSVCCAVVALSTAFTGAAAGFASLFVLRIALGLGEGPAFPTATRAMSRWMRAERWGFAQGITHSFARMGNAITPPLMAGLLAFASWRTSFVILGAASLVWLAVWAWYFRDNPREHPAMTEADLRLLLAPATTARPQIPWWPLARRMLPVTATDFCYGWTLWLFLSWIPSFFFESYRLDLRASALFSGGVLFAGVVGDTVGGIWTDRLLRATGNVRLARRAVLVTGFLGAFAFLLPVILFHNLTVAAACLSAAFFFAELIVAPMWSVPMDIARRYAGSASGMMNFGFGLAGLVSPSSFGYLVDLTGSWVVPFLGSVVLLLIGALLALRLRPDEEFAG
ncbi:MAG TPA: MFS transporter [Bryobacteraceae bacterium]|nr:MFS transporter [Bryobacteraceae bacterium]